ncbi:Uncharacterised protein [Citrobacter koseri]|nr:Uncharacterised protein [Citrobacter koseri]
MFVRADLGADPWNVFHLGVANLLSMNIGMVIIAVGVLVLLLWIPLRQRPGLGTISNVIVIGLAADVALAVLPAFESLLVRSVLLSLRCSGQRAGDQHVYWGRFRRRPARWPDDPGFTRAPGCRYAPSVRRLKFRYC